MERGRGRGRGAGLLHDSNIDIYLKVASQFFLAIVTIACYIVQFIIIIIAELLPLIFTIIRSCLTRKIEEPSIHTAEQSLDPDIGYDKWSTTTEDDTSDPGISTDDVDTVAPYIWKYPIPISMVCNKIAGGTIYPEAQCKLCNDIELNTYSNKIKRYRDQHTQTVRSDLKQNSTQTNKYNKTKCTQTTVTYSTSIHMSLSNLKMQTSHPKHSNNSSQRQTVSNTVSVQTEVSNVEQNICSNFYKCNVTSDYDSTREFNLVNQTRCSKKSIEEDELFLTSTRTPPKICTETSFSGSLDSTNIFISTWFLFDLLNLRGKTENVHSALRHQDIEKDIKMYDDLQVFELYAERNGTVSDDSSNFGDTSYNGSSEEEILDDKDDARFFHIDSVKFHKNRLLINARICVDRFNWNTLVLVKPPALYHCAVCSEEVRRHEAVRHMDLGSHKIKLNIQKPLQKYGEHLIRKISNTEIHCAICNKIYPESTDHMLDTLHCLQFKMAVEAANLTENTKRIIQTPSVDSTNGVSNKILTYDNIVEKTKQNVVSVKINDDAKETKKITINNLSNLKEQPVTNEPLLFVDALKVTEPKAGNVLEVVKSNENKTKVTVRTNRNETNITETKNDNGSKAPGKMNESKPNDGNKINVTKQANENKPKLTDGTDVTIHTNAIKTKVSTDTKKLLPQSSKVLTSNYCDMSELLKTGSVKFDIKFIEEIVNCKQNENKSTTNMYLEDTQNKISNNSENKLICTQITKQNTTMSHEIAKKHCILTPTDGEVVLSMASYNTIVGNDEVCTFCLICQEPVRYFSDHINSKNHIERMHKHPFCVGYGKHLVRKIDSSTQHCGICNIVMNKNNIRKHIETIGHLNLLRKAEIVVPKCEEIVSKVTVDVKTDEIQKAKKKSNKRKIKKVLVVTEESVKNEHENIEPIENVPVTEILHEYETKVKGERNKNEPNPTSGTNENKTAVVKRTDMKEIKFTGETDINDREVTERIIKNKEKHTGRLKVKVNTAEKQQRRNSEDIKSKAESNSASVEHVVISFLSKIRVRVALNSWHGIVKDKCIFCESALEPNGIQGHVTSAEHENNMKIYTIDCSHGVQHLIRQVKKQIHCGICNMVIPTKHVHQHLSSNKHETALEKAKTGGSEIKLSHFIEMDIPQVENVPDINIDQDKNKEKNKIFKEIDEINADCVNLQNNLSKVQCNPEKGDLHLYADQVIAVLDERSVLVTAEKFNSFLDKNKDILQCAFCGTFYKNKLSDNHRIIPLHYGNCHLIPGRNNFQLMKYIRVSVPFREPTLACYDKTMQLELYYAECEICNELVEVNFTEHFSAENHKRNLKLALSGGRQTFEITPICINIDNTFYLNEISRDAYEGLLEPSMGTRKCVLCDVLLKKKNFRAHLESEGHVLRTKNEFLPEYEPHLVRLLNSGSLHCCLCNKEMHKQDIQQHLKGAGHTNTFSAYKEAVDFITSDLIVTSNGTEVLITKRAYNGIRITDGLGECRICQSIFKTSVIRHVECREHRAKMFIDFNPKYGGNLIRQFDLSRSHCSFCNECFLSNDTELHTSKLQHRAAMAAAREAYLELKTNYRIDQLTLPASSTSAADANLKRKKLKKSLNSEMAVSDVAKLNEEPYMDPRDREVDLNINNCHLLINLDSWHTIMYWTEFVCMLCGVRMRECDIEEHIETRKHEFLMMSSLVKRFHPHLIRQMGEKTYFCCMCKAVIPESLNIRTHVKHDSEHLENFMKAIKSF